MSRILIFYIDTAGLVSKELTLLLYIKYSVKEDVNWRFQCTDVGYPSLRAMKTIRCNENVSPFGLVYIVKFKHSGYKSKLRFFIL